MTNNCHMTDLGHALQLTEAAQKEALSHQSHKVNFCGVEHSRARHKRMDFNLSANTPLVA
jgi:hypothetical protein